MSAMEKNKKWITLAVLVTFVWLTYLASAPLPAASENEGISPMAVEKTAVSKPVIKKKSILPLILIGVGVLAAAAALYFLVLKKDSEKIHDDFDSAADALWLPRTASAWTVAGGYYVCQKAHGSAAPDTWWEWSLYNRAWTKANYTVTVRMRITGNVGPFGLLLTTDSSMQAANGYQFMFYGDGNFFIRKVQGWNYSQSTVVSYDWITTSPSHWEVSPAILTGLGTWNTYKIVKAGGDYKLYANDTLVYSFTDATYDPRLVAIAVHTMDQAMHLEVDSFYVDMN
ncbi:MAG: hypothetical protein NTZ12_05210 [Candidatus Aminicenantes bacterium]|nr:hypothetical protein [Candidatus Aminicenantes bacterium]